MARLFENRVEGWMVNPFLQLDHLFQLTKRKKK